MDRFVQYQKSLPVRGEYDVIVCGGGPAGFPAALAAARSGKKTVIVEKLGFFGGTATAGLVVPISGAYLNGTKVVGGISHEFIDRLVDMGAASIELPKGHVSFDPEQYKILVRRMLAEAGVECLTNTSVVDVLCSGDGRKINGIVVTNKQGPSVLLGKTIIDCTGDADLVGLAGGTYLPRRPESQPMTLCFLLGGVDLTTDLLKDYIRHDGVAKKSSQVKEIYDYLNSLPEEAGVPRFGGPWFNTILQGDCIAVNLTRCTADALDPADLERAEHTLRENMFTLVNLLKEHFPEFKNAYIAGSALIGGVRETRQIKGAYVLTGEELFAGVPFADSIARNAHPMDIHSATSSSQQCVRMTLSGYIPYRILVTAEFDNLLVAGRSVSVDYKAQASIRVQATVMALGEAAGFAAAEYLAEEAESVRDIAIDKLHARLDAVGAIY